MGRAGGRSSKAGGPELFQRGNGASGRRRWPRWRPYSTLCSYPRSSERGSEGGRRAYSLTCQGLLLSFLPSSLPFPVWHSTTCVEGWIEGRRVGGTDGRMDGRKEGPCSTGRDLETSPKRQFADADHDERERGERHGQNFTADGEGGRRHRRWRAWAKMP